MVGQAVEQRGLQPLPSLDAWRAVRRSPDTWSLARSATAGRRSSRRRSISAASASSVTRMRWPSGRDQAPCSAKVGPAGEQKGGVVAGGGAGVAGGNEAGSLALVGPGEAGRHPDLVAQILRGFDREGADAVVRDPDVACLRRWPRRWGRDGGRRRRPIRTSVPSRVACVAGAASKAASRRTAARFGSPRPRRRDGFDRAWGARGRVRRGRWGCGGRRRRVSRSDLAADKDFVGLGPSASAAGSSSPARASWVRARSHSPVMQKSWNRKVRSARIPRRPADLGLEQVESLTDVAGTEGVSRSHGRG